MHVVKITRDGMRRADSRLAPPNSSRLCAPETLSNFHPRAPTLKDLLHRRECLAGGFNAEVSPTSAVDDLQTNVLLVRPQGRVQALEQNDVVLGLLSRKRVHPECPFDALKGISSSSREWVMLSCPTISSR